MCNVHQYLYLIVLTRVTYQPNFHTPRIAILQVLISSARRNGDNASRPVTHSMAIDRKTARSYLRDEGEIISYGHS